MAKDNETTLKLRADISELKKEFQEAQRTVRVANAEFNAATAGLDNWAESADGLSSKVNQLSKVLEAEKIKQENLNAQYEKTVQLQGENSKGAQELLVKLNNQKAAVAKVEKELNKWQTALDEVGKENTDIVQTISKQEKELASLKDQYAKVVIEQGKESAAAKKLEAQISELSGELKQNKTSLADARKEADKFDETLDNVEDGAKDASDGFTVMKGALANLIADGIKAAVDVLVDMTKELASVDKAYNNFQAQTGKSAKEMEEFTEQINEVYKNNFGESLDDVADAMAKVAQNSKETDPSKIKELTENALALRETFGYDINESMRAVNMLMDQFGISGDEAFNLIIQGAQNGLDKNGDLLDSINEYSVHYKQLGYDADDFFNSLANGTDAGTFSVDKLGDAMKEFGIRTKDTANTTTEGFELLGLSAEGMRKEFAKGGESAQKATKKTLKALFEMEDEVKQNQAGVDLFGTMWEDLGKEGVKALMDTQGELTSTKKSMEEIKQIKYDDVMNDISALGRQFKMDVLLPLVQQAMPQIRSALNWVTENLDSLVPIIGAVGAALAAVFVVNKIATFAQSIMTLVGTMKTLKTATDAATVATKAQTASQVALNATNPFGWVALAVSALALLIPLVVKLATGSNNLAEEYAKLNASEQALRDETNELTKSYKDWDNAKQTSIKNKNAEFGYYQELKNELDGIVDENGKIKKGYEDRAAVITGILSDALGIEIQITDGVIQKYGELKKSIDDVIVAKKAEAMLNALEQDYITAIQNKSAALQNYTANQEAYKKSLDEANAAKAEFNKLLELGEIEFAKENGIIPGSIQAKHAYAKATDEAREKVKGLNAKFSDQKKALGESEEAYFGYIQTIENYEGVSAAIVSGDTDKINKSLIKLENGFLTARTATKEALEGQTEDYKNELANLKKAIKEKTPGVTQEQVDQMEKLVEESEAELAKLSPKAEKQGEKGAESFGEGIENEKGTVKKDAEKVADKAEEGLESADSKSVGEDFTKGFGEGLDDKKGSVWDKAFALGKKALDAVKKATGTHSPSKEAKKIGKFFSDGLGEGISEGETDVTKRVASLAENLIGRMENELVYDKLVDETKDCLDERYDAIKKALDKELKAFEKTQDEELAAFKAAREKEMAAYENEHNYRLDLIDEEYTEKLKLVDEETYKKIKAIDDEIDGINAMTEAEEKAIKEEENQKKILELKEKARKAETIEERREAEQELADFEKQLAREKLLEERKLRIAELNKRKEEVNEQAEAEKEALKSQQDFAKMIEGVTYEMKRQSAEKEWDEKETALKSEQELALENLKERHETALANIKKELEVELEALELQKEEALKVIAELETAKAEAAQRAADKAKGAEIQRRYEGNLIAAENDALKAKTEAEEVGENISQGIADGMLANMGVVGQAAEILGKTAIDAIKRATDTHSPSRAAMEIGQFFSEGLGIGIADGENEIVKSIKSLAMDITETLSDELDFGADLLSPLTADIGKLTTRDFRSNAATSETKNVTNVTNFYQTNNSPKALSRTEIYRQTKNQLAFSGGAK